MFRKIVQPFYTTYALLTFIVWFLAAFPFNVLFSLGNNIKARKWVNQATRLCFQSWLWLVGMPLRVVGKKHIGRFIFIANHGSYIDDIIIFPAIHGHFRPLGKKEMAKIPIWGYQYKHIVIMVDRKSPESRAASMQEMEQVVKKEGSVLIFPEGTFNETANPLKDFYDGAFRLAIATQTPIAPIIFPDAIKRAPHSNWWKLWPGPNRAIPLEPISVNGLTLEQLPQLKQQAYTAMEAALIRYQHH